MAGSLVGGGEGNRTKVEMLARVWRCYITSMWIDRPVVT